MFFRISSSFAISWPREAFPPHSLVAPLHSCSLFQFHKVGKPLSTRGENMLHFVPKKLASTIFALHRRHTHFSFTSVNKNFPMLLKIVGFLLRCPCSHFSPAIALSSLGVLAREVDRRLVHRLNHVFTAWTACDNF